MSEHSLVPVTQTLLDVQMQTHHIMWLSENFKFHTFKVAAFHSLAPPPLPFGEPARPLGPVPLAPSQPQGPLMRLIGINGTWEEALTDCYRRGGPLLETADSGDQWLLGVITALMWYRNPFRDSLGWLFGAWRSGDSLFMAKGEVATATSHKSQKHTKAQSHTKEEESLNRFRLEECVRMLHLTAQYPEIKSRGERLGQD